MLVLVLRGSLVWEDGFGGCGAVLACVWGECRGWFVLMGLMEWEWKWKRIIGKKGRVVGVVFIELGRFYECLGI